LEAYLINKTQFGIKNPRTWTSQNGMAQVYIAQERFDDAEKLLKSMLDVQKDDVSENTLENLINRYKMTEKKAELEKYQKLLLSKL
jgi:hypothetical protein